MIEPQEENESLKKEEGKAEITENVKHKRHQSLHLLWGYVLYNPIPLKG